MIAASGKRRRGGASGASGGEAGDVAREAAWVAAQALEGLAPAATSARLGMGLLGKGAAEDGREMEDEETWKAARKVVHVLANKKQLPTAYGGTRGLGILLEWLQGHFANDKERLEKLHEEAGYVDGFFEAVKLLCDPNLRSNRKRWKVLVETVNRFIRAGNRNKRRWAEEGPDLDETTPATAKIPMTPTADGTQELPYSSKRVRKAPADDETHVDKPENRKVMVQTDNNTTTGTRSLAAQAEAQAAAETLWSEAAGGLASMSGMVASTKPARGQAFQMLQQQQLQLRKTQQQQQRLAKGLFGGEASPAAVSPFFAAAAKLDKEDKEQQHQQQQQEGSTGRVAVDNFCNDALTLSRRAVLLESRLGDLLNQNDKDALLEAAIGLLSAEKSIHAAREGLAAAQDCLWLRLGSLGVRGADVSMLKRSVSGLSAVTSPWSTSMRSTSSSTSAQEPKLLALLSSVDGDGVGTGSAKTSPLAAPSPPQHHVTPSPVSAASPNGRGDMAASVVSQNGEAIGTTTATPSGEREDDASGGFAGDEVRADRDQNIDNQDKRQGQDQNDQADRNKDEKHEKDTDKDQNTDGGGESAFGDRVLVGDEMEQEHEDLNSCSTFTSIMGKPIPSTELDFARGEPPCKVLAQPPLWVMCDVPNIYHALKGISIVFLLRKGFVFSELNFDTVFKNPRKGELNNRVDIPAQQPGTSLIRCKGRTPFLQVESTMAYTDAGHACFLVEIKMKKMGASMATVTIGGTSSGSGRKVQEWHSKMEPVELRTKASSRDSVTASRLLALHKDRDMALNRIRQWMFCPTQPIPEMPWRGAPEPSVTENFHALERRTRYLGTLVNGGQQQHLEKQQSQHVFDAEDEEEDEEDAVAATPAATAMGPDGQDDSSSQKANEFDAVACLQQLASAATSASG